MASRKEQVKGGCAIIKRQMIQTINMCATFLNILIAGVNYPYCYHKEVACMEHDIDPTTEHQLENSLIARAEKARAIRQKPSILPPDDDRRDLLVSMLQRWSSELKQLESILDL